MSASLRLFHECYAIVANKLYRCRRCNKDLALAELAGHAVANQLDMTREQP